MRFFIVNRIVLFFCGGGWVCYRSSKRYLGVLRGFFSNVGVGMKDNDFERVIGK